MMFNTLFQIQFSLLVALMYKVSYVTAETNFGIGPTNNVNCMVPDYTAGELASDVVLSFVECSSTTAIWVFSAWPGITQISTLLSQQAELSCLENPGIGQMIRLNKCNGLKAQQWLFQDQGTIMSLLDDSTCVQSMPFGPVAGECRMDENNPGVVPDDLNFTATMSE